MSSVGIPPGKGKVLLVNPPSPFLIEERVFAPTGILYAAAELRKNSIPVEVLDLARRPRASDRDTSYDVLVSDYEREYLDQVRAAAPEFGVVGVSATTPQYKFAAKILDAVREVNPDARTVIGGSHPTLISGLRNRRIAHHLHEDPSYRSRPADLEAALDDFDPNFASVGRFDHVVAGGSSGIMQIINGNGSTPKWITSEKLGRSLDDIPLPARDLIDLASYNYTLKNPHTGEVVRTTNVMSQWGCPFPCNFCSGRDDDFYRTVRKVSPEATVRELDEINDKYGIKGFMFFDDELNIDNPRFRELLVLLKQRHQERGYVYRGFVKSELITNRYPDTYKLMIDAGFAEACTGVESGSDRILKEVIMKNTTRDINLRSAELAREAGISFKAFTMIGHPTETELDAMDTYKWILSARPTGFDITVHQPYPGAPVYDFAVKDSKTGHYFLTPREVNPGPKRVFPNGSLVQDAVFFFKKIDFADPGSDSFYKGKPGEYVSNVWTPDLTPERIVELRDVIERDAKRILGASSVSGLSYDSVMGQSAGAQIRK